MKKRFLVIVLIILAANFCFGQSNCTNNLLLKVRCFENNPKLSKENNSFILEIFNSDCPSVYIDQEINFGHHGDTNYSDLTFELLYVAGVDTANMLRRIANSRAGWPGKKSEKIKLYSNSGYLIEFSFLRDYYFTKPGQYLIRFTLLRKYAPQYMTEDISTEWITFVYQ